MTEDLNIGSLIVYGGYYEDISFEHDAFAVTFTLFYADADFQFHCLSK